MPPFFFRRWMLRPHILHESTFILVGVYPGSQLKQMPLFWIFFYQCHCCLLLLCNITFYLKSLVLFVTYWTGTVRKMANAFKWPFLVQFVNLCTSRLRLSFGAICSILMKFCLEYESWDWLYAWYVSWGKASSFELHSIERYTQSQRVFSFWRRLGSLSIGRFILPAFSLSNMMMFRNMFKYYWTTTITHNWRESNANRMRTLLEKHLFFTLIGTFIFAST